MKPLGVERWRDLGQQLRADAVRVSAKAKSGHPTSSMSAADLAAVLLDGHLRYDFDNPRDPRNDRLVFSKGHASPLVYGLFRAAGVISEQEFMTYREFGSRLEGHPVPVLPWVDVATGSLGQGLPIGVGMALAGKWLNRTPMRVWVICGDSEMAEGSMWEAIEHAAFYELDNLTAIIDVNRLGQRGETCTAGTSPRTRAAWRRTVGTRSKSTVTTWRRSTVPIARPPPPPAARPRSSRGRSRARVTPLWRTRRGGTERQSRRKRPKRLVAELGGVRNVVVDVAKPHERVRERLEHSSRRKRPRYEVGSEVATRKAYGDALAWIGGEDEDVVALDGEVSNSTYAEIFAKAHPKRFFEMYIAEQQMIATAVGMQVLGWKPFASTFAAFISRAYDFVRMAAISRATIRLCGSHAGVSIGEDGPSQMGLEDLASLRAIHGSTVLYPCDGNQTVALVQQMADLDGISYLRTTRAATRIVYDSGEQFPVGGSKVLRSSDGDDVTIVAAGITVHEALAAAYELEAEGIHARVIDAYSVKPIDAATLHAAAGATGARIVTVEDHRAEGGLGEAVLAAFAGHEQPIVKLLAVREMPSSGKPAELVAAAGIDAAHIADAARELVSERQLTARR